jgi:hypothetical protein
MAIKGYRELSEQELVMINEIKDGEAAVGELWRSVQSTDAVDQRWLAVAKTHFQEGFTALVRSIAQPEDVF